MQVHYQLDTIKKSNTSIADYFQKFTGLTDTLAAVNQPLNDFEVVSFLLAGLKTDYDSFVTSVTTCVDPMTLDEIYGHLLAHEQRITHQLSSLDVSLAGANFAAKGNPIRGGRHCTSSYGRDNFHSTPTPSPTITAVGVEEVSPPPHLVQFGRCATKLDM